MSPATTVATNIANRYGIAGLDLLVGSLRAQIPHGTIAGLFGVTKARVGQWAQVLGATVTAYLVHPDIERIANEPDLEEVPHV